MPKKSIYDGCFRIAGTPYVDGERWVCEYFKKSKTNRMGKKQAKWCWTESQLRNWIEDNKDRILQADIVYAKQWDINKIGSIGVSGECCGKFFEDDQHQVG